MSKQPARHEIVTARRMLEYRDREIEIIAPSNGERWMSCLRTPGVEDGFILQSRSERNALASAQVAIDYALHSDYPVPEEGYPLKEISSVDMYRGFNFGVDYNEENLSFTVTAACGDNTYTFTGKSRRAALRVATTSLDFLLDQAGMTLGLEQE